MFGVDGLILEPLIAGWNGRRAEVPWREREDGLAATAALPFGACELTCAREASGVARVAVTVRIDRPTRLDALDVRYRTASPVTRAWTPHLRPGRDFVIADVVFRAPAIVAGLDGASVALVPDLSLWPEGVRSYLDFVRATNGGAVLAHGLGPWRETGHVFFRRVRARTVLPAGTTVRAAHYLLTLPADFDEALRAASSFLWERFARRADVRPQVLPFARCAERVTMRIFAPDLYHEFRAGDVPVGAMIAQTVTAKRVPKVLDARGVDSYLKRQKSLVALLRWVQAHAFVRPLGNELLARLLHSGRMAVAPMAWFQAWNNQVRTAVGAALCARRAGDAATMDRAAKLIELALSAPLDDGYPASICLFPGGRPRWVRGTRAFELIGDAHLADAAVTGFHLLEWHERIAADPRILDRCRALAAFLIARQDDAGAFPAWVRREGSGWVADPRLYPSAETAASAMFLARWARHVPDTGVREATARAIAFLRREVLPEEKWFDFELVYSCAGRPTGQEGPDPFTRCWPANTLAMYWAARAGIDLFLATGDATGGAPGGAAALAFGRACLDRLSLFQQVADHPHIAIDTFGGFGVMNADGEWNDARQGVFVPLYLDFHRATREPELMDRAIAALRASFTTMLTPEHKAVAPGNFLRYRESDRGAILENYGHTGRDEMTPGYFAPDWGCGTALYALGFALADAGQVYVDAANGRAFGIDLCSARFVRRDGDVVVIEVAGADRDALEIVLDDPTGAVARLVVGGREAERVAGSPMRFRARVG